MTHGHSFTGPIDLHLHSNHSDGTETPAEVMVRAHEFGVRTAALTDHDRTTGWDEAIQSGCSLGMTVVPGIELSAKQQWRSVHMLGYLFDPTNAALVEETSRIRSDRVGRAERIVRKIGRDYDITWDDVRAQTADDATVGRPHIADALVALGIAPDRTAAFAGVLHPNAGYYEPHYAPDPVVAVTLIAQAGGVPILAHPATDARDRLSVESWEELIAHGLQGVEIDHRENTAEGKELLRSLAKRHDLIITGSSDYHGEGKPNRPGENTTDPAMLARIVERATGSSVHTP